MVHFLGVSFSVNGSIVTTVEVFGLSSAPLVGARADESIKHQSIFRNPVSTLSRAVRIVKNQFCFSVEVANVEFRGATGSLLIAEVISVWRPAEANALTFDERLEGATLQIARTDLFFRRVQQMRFVSSRHRFCNAGVMVARLKPSPDCVSSASAAPFAGSPFKSNTRPSELRAGAFRRLRRAAYESGRDYGPRDKQIDSVHG
jgi:hypothetical protein